MKSLAFLFGLLMFSTLSSAQIANDLEIFSDEGLKFTLIVNGKTLNAEPQSNVKIENTQNDQVQVKIIFEDTSIPDIEKKYLQIGTPGPGEHPAVSTVYKISLKKKGYKLKFVSRTNKSIQQDRVIIIDR